MPDGSKGLNGTPVADLPLYGSQLLQDWLTDELVIIAEGEKAARALLDAGLPALGTVTGASGTPNPEVLRVLRDRRVCLWPDNDDQGGAHMERIADRLDGVVAEVLVYTWHEAPEKGDAADHPATKSKNPKAVDRLLTELEDAPRWKARVVPKENDTDDPTPTTLSTPIVQELPTATDFPVEALPSTTRRFVKEAARAIGCPPDLVAVPLLATLSVGIGASRVVQLKRRWSESAALFLAVVAPPGSKKTPAQKAATEPVWVSQSRMKCRYSAEREAYEAECRRWEAEKRNARQDRESEPEPPHEPTMGRTVVEDATVEALHSVLEANPRGVLDIEDELSGWVRRMDQYKGGKGADRQFFLGVWSNRSVAVDRKGKSVPTIIERPWLSLIGSIQPSVLWEIASKREDGMLDRFLCSYPDTTPARLSDDDVSQEAIDQIKGLYDKLANLKMREGENG
jgi:hypothetical protein